LILTGYEPCGTGALSKEYVLHLFDFLRPAGEIPTAERQALVRLDAKLDDPEYKPEGDERKAGLDALRRLRELFDARREALVEAHGERETALQSQCLDNYLVRESYEYSRINSATKGRPETFNGRFEQMAANLKWLAEVRYPDQKIIAWSSTVHLARNLEKVSVEGNPDYFHGCRVMGEHIHEWFGRSVFTMGFVAYGGECGTPTEKFPVPTPKKGSFEELMRRYGAPLLLVPLRPRNPFGEPMLAAPLSYGRNTSAPWPEVLDALFYIQEMTASSR